MPPGMAPCPSAPAELKQLVELSRMGESELQEYVRREIPDYERMIGVEHRPLSNVEMLNRDYYRGRFASRAGSEMIYNWEERPAF